MAFRDMQSEIRGWVAKLSTPLSQTLVNRALQKIYDESTWSFQLSESGWITPGLVAQGKITAVLGASTIVGDAVASAAWGAIPAPFLITSFQIRLPAYALYSVVAAQTNTPSAGLTTLTLDRPWMEPAGVGLTYNLYQAYYPAPVKDFKRWLAVRDFTNACNLDFWSWKQADLDSFDPQRTIFQNPNHVVPYLVDNRVGSSTPGYMLFELYPQPLATLPYSLYFSRSGPLLVNPGDTIPYPLEEELVLMRAKLLAYEWKEAQKGEDTKRGSGADYRFLMQSVQGEYEERLKDIRKRDRDIADAFWTKLRRNAPSIGAPYYSSITGQASVGSFGA